MSQTKLYLQLVASLEEKELYELAHAYLTNVDGLSKVIITNSSYDSGIDLKVMDKFEVQYQATVQSKAFEIKLKGDIKKASDNVKDKGLPNKVKYFYSHPISEGNVIEYRKFAKDTYGIYLEMIDAKVIAQIAVSYDEISSLLYAFAKMKVPTQESNFFSKPNTKALYDLMSFGKSTDIKYNIMQCFVLNHLFVNKDRSFSKEEILIELESHFHTTMNKDYFARFIGKLSTDKKIKLTKTNVELTEIESNRIKKVLESYKLEESILINEISKVLEKYGIKENIDIIITKLADIYESNYTSNLGELINRGGNGHSVTVATQKLKETLISISSTEIAIDTLIGELLKATDNNEILSRISAGQAYSKVNDPTRLQQYISRNINNKDIFLDTNVLINLILVHYLDTETYRDYNYLTAREFLRFTSHYELHLKTIRKYAIEVTDLFRQALTLVPFSKLPVFDSLGGSGNILYKFYQHLKDNDELSEDIKFFGDFLNEFHFNENKKDYQLKSSVEWLLKDLKIEIEEITEYNTTEAVKIISEELNRVNKDRPYGSINNDAIMFMRLADDDIDINPLDPIFCTWDMGLIGARKRYFNDFQNATRWFMFTPSRLMDHYAMMNFQIRPGTVSNEVLSILSEDHKQMTESLLQSMTLIINPENEVGLRHTNKIAALREKEIVEVDIKPETSNENSNEATSIDLILTTIVKHYLTNDKERFDLLKAVFTKEAQFEPIGIYLSKHSKYFSENGRLSDNLVDEMNTIINIKN